MAEGANVTLLLAWLFETGILENLVQCWYTSLPTGLLQIEHAKATSKVKKSPGGLGCCKCLRCSIIEGKIEPFTATQMIYSVIYVKITLE